MQLILASASPRRRELLSDLVKEFAVIPPKGEESAEGKTPAETVMRRAEEKAREIWEGAAHPCAVIGCDTAVVVGNTVYGKPHTVKNAEKMLRELVLFGEHYVMSGLCFLGEKVQRTLCEVTRVVVKPLSEEEIATYVRECPPLDKAGAYGIQDKICIVESIDGSYSNVVGLPMESLKILLKEEGIL